MDADAHISGVVKKVRIKLPNRLDTVPCSITVEVPVGQNISSAAMPIPEVMRQQPDVVVPAAKRRCTM